jgi:hypothetical protein
LHFKWKIDYDESRNGSGSRIIQYHEYGTKIQCYPVHEGDDMNFDPRKHRPGPTGQRREPQSDFEEFEATELFCPQCRRAVAVRKVLLLILPDGDKYEYRCRFCGTKVGDQTNRSGQFYGLLKS